MERLTTEQLEKLQEVIDGVGEGYGLRHLLLDLREELQGLHLLVLDWSDLLPELEDDLLLVSIEAQGLAGVTSANYEAVSRVGLKINNAKEGFDGGTGLSVKYCDYIGEVLAGIEAVDGVRLVEKVEALERAIQAPETNRDMHDKCISIAKRRIDSIEGLVCVTNQRCATMRAQMQEACVTIGQE